MCGARALPNPHNLSQIGAPCAASAHFARLCAPNRRKHDAMRPRRQANSIRLEAQDCQLAHQLVAQRRLNSLAELIRDLIREAAKVPQAPKVPARMADLARRLDVSVDVAL